LSHALHGITLSARNAPDGVACNHPAPDKRAETIVIYHYSSFQGKVVMANRKKRLEREQAMLQKQQREQEALLKNKQEQAVRRKLKAAQQYATQYLSACGDIHPDWQIFIDKKLRSAALRSQLPELMSAMVPHKDRLVRSPVSWQPTGKMRRRQQVLDFVRHSFVRYEMPEFLLRDFLEPQETKLVEKVFFHLSEGQNLRHFNDFWQNITKMEAHWYLRAPKYLHWQAAIAWATAKAAGFSTEQCAILADSYAQFFKEHFLLWRDFLVFIIRHPQLTPFQWREIATFVFHQRIQGDYTIAIQWVEVRIKALFPTLDIRTAVLSSLQRRMSEQQQEITYWKKNYRNLKFPKGPIPDGTITHNAVTYHIRQLTDATDLMAESTAMKHCVKTYQFYCHHGRCFIYSMTKTTENGESVERVGTIEVYQYDTGYCLDQFKAKYNTRPEEPGFLILKRWLADYPEQVKWDGISY
jgi:hypothetical protein